MVLLPAVTASGKVLVAQVFHAPVPSKERPVTRAPLTSTSTGRAVVVPLANRTPTVAVAVTDAFTVNCAEAPTALLPLQNPVPEYPDQLVSMEPVHTAGAA